MSLIKAGQSLPATSPEALARLAVVQESLIQTQQIELVTEHILHGGLYARTIRMEPGTYALGALVKVPTLLIVQGHCAFLVDDQWHDMVGYNVFPAEANRKQVCVAWSKTEITMLFRTDATTVEEAEREFTDEHELLASRRPENDKDIVVITGEQGGKPCLELSASAPSPR